MSGRWGCDRRFTDFDMIGFGESHLLRTAVCVDKIEAMSRPWMVHRLAIHPTVGRIGPRPRSWCTDGGIVPPRMEMARTTVLASLLAAPADKEEASHCQDTDQDHKSQNRERNDQSQAAGA